ncbi:MAG: TonB-dependent receptor [Rhodanobacter sp.]|nr:MAG: TonB-dependent receptor [Rhodanobacter sp.]TAM08763.1 MAG: TonB-dependent receptor [Rhodanobacter sp.]TAM36805.1 MAG: TonB-dependent receptor [Rhodanobacter sp.]
MSKSFRAAPRVSLLAMAVAMALAGLPSGALAATTPANSPEPQGAGDHANAHSAVTLGPVYVIGTDGGDANAHTRKVPGGVYATSGASLKGRAINNLADALRYVPGVMANSNAGGDDLTLSIRGSNLNSIAYDNAGVALLQDGLPVSAADGNNHNRMLDPRMASNLIVANGANALTYGASTLGGAIDVISRTALNSDPRTLSVTGGSHGNGEATLSTGGVTGNYDGMLTLDAKHHDGYRRHSHQNRDSLYANGGWQATENLELRAYATYINNRQQLPGALTRDEFHADPWQADPAYALGNHQLNVTTARLALKGIWNLTDDSSLEFGVSNEAQRLYHPIVDVYVPGGPAPDAPLLDVFSLLINTTQRTTGGMLRYHLHAGDHDIVAGVNLAQTTNRGGNYANEVGTRGKLQALVNKRTTQANLFAMDRWQVAPGWTLVYGAQGTTTRLIDRQVDGFDHGNRTPRNQTNRFSAVNPRVGVIHQFTAASQIYASAGTLYQSPNTFDLDNARMDLGPTTSLKATRGESYELGMRAASDGHGVGPRWHWSVSGYLERLRNEVFSIDNPNAPGTSLTTNLPRTVHAGIEAQASASLPLANGTRLEPLVSASWNDFSFRHDPHYGNHRLPSAPRYALHAELMWRTAGGYFLGPTLDAIGTRYADFANSYRVGGHTLLGLRGGWRQGRWELYAQADNLANRRYAASIGVFDRVTATDGVLNPGAPRSLYVGATYHY